MDLQMQTLQNSFSQQLANNSSSVKSTTNNQRFSNQVKISDSEAKVIKTAKEFEAFFLFQSFELMEPETDSDSFFSGGEAEKMFRPILNEQKANVIVEGGGIGITDSIHKQLLKYQEVR